MKLHHFFLLCAFGLFLGSCKSSTSPNSAVTMSELFPLAVGDSWTYRGEAFDTSGVKEQDTTVSLINILSAIQFQGHQAFVTTIGNPNDSGILYVSGTDLFQAPVQNPKPSLTLRYPMNSSESLVLSDTTFPDGYRNKSYIIFRGNNESVSVPAGTFTCYHYDNIVLTGSSPVLDTAEFDQLYLFPNVGMVQEKSYSNISKRLYLSTKLSLVSYTVR